MKEPLKVHIEGTYALGESYPDGYSARRKAFDRSMRARYGLYDGGGFLRYLTSPDRQEETGGVRRPGVPFDMSGRDLLAADVDGMSQRARVNGSAVCYGHLKLYAPYDGNMTREKWKGLVSSVFPSYFLSLGMNPGNVDAVFVAHTAEGHPPHLHFVFWERGPDRIVCREGHAVHYTPFAEIRKSAGTLSSLTLRRLESRSRAMATESARDAAREIRRAKDDGDVRKKDICMDLLKIAGEMYAECREAGWRPPVKRYEDAPPMEEKTEERVKPFLAFPDTRAEQPRPGFLSAPVLPCPDSCLYVSATPGTRGAERPAVPSGHPYVKIGDAIPIDVERHRAEARKVAEKMSAYDPSVREGDALVRLSAARARHTVLTEGNGDTGMTELLEEAYVKARENMVLRCATDLADTITPYGDELATGAHRGRSRKIKLDYRRKYEEAFFSSFHEKVPEMARATVMDEERTAEMSVRKREEEREAEKARSRDMGGRCR